MLIKRYYRQKRLQQRSVFRKKKNKRTRSAVRQLTVGILYFFIGIYLLLFLDLIPKLISSDSIISQAWADLFIGITKLYDSISSIFSILLILLLIIMGILIYLLCMKVLIILLLENGSI